MNARPTLAAAALVALAALVPTSVGPAASATAPHPHRGLQRAATVEPTDELATDLLTPLSLATDPSGAIWFTEDLRASLSRLVPGQPATRIYRAHGHHQLGAVSVDGDRVFFALSGNKMTLGRLMSTGLGGGKATMVADLGDFERSKNPDGRQRYGFRKLPASCASRFDNARSVSYLGKEQTNPYDTLHQGHKAYVADAGANAILEVRDSGKVKAVTVFPSVYTTVTRAFARENKLPRCTVNQPYRAEAVPTGVAAGPDNTLYVTTLGGGPAAEGREPRGALWQVDASSGKKTRIADDLDTPTGLTVAPNGDIYVAELFAGQIVRIPAGTDQVVPFAQPAYPGDVLATPAGLVASTNVLSGSSPKSGDPVAGTIVRYAYP